MALKTEKEIKEKIKELHEDVQKLNEFLKDIYEDEDAGKKIEAHTWRIRREMEILNWVLNNDLPF